jgi:hypothetical protein
VAGGGDREQAVQAVVLAGAIITGAGNEAADVRAEHAAPPATLAAAVHRHRATAADRTEYLYLLQAMLSVLPHRVLRRRPGGGGAAPLTVEWPGRHRFRLVQPVMTYRS